MPVTSRPSTRIAPGRRPEQPGDQVEQRGLAGAVRPDDGEELARRDVERDVVDDRAATDPPGQGVQAERAPGPGVLPPGPVRCARDAVVISRTWSRPAVAGSGGAIVVGSTALTSCGVHVVPEPVSLAWNSGCSSAWSAARTVYWPVDARERPALQRRDLLVDAARVGLDGVREHLRRGEPVRREQVDGAAGLLHRRSSSRPRSRCCHRRPRSSARGRRSSRRPRRSPDRSRVFARPGHHLGRRQDALLVERRPHLGRVRAGPGHEQQVRLGRGDLPGERVKSVASGGTSTLETVAPFAPSTAFTPAALAWPNALSCASTTTFLPVRSPTNVPAVAMS